MIDMDIIHALRARETALWQEATRFDDAWMDDILAPEFTELGRSGRRYARAEMFLQNTNPDPIRARLPLPDFRVRAIGPDTMLVTYTSDVTYPTGRERANRASVWTRASGRWQITFHQGTPIP